MLEIRLLKYIVSHDSISLIEKSNHRVPSSIQITALCTSCLMILVGQANAWYANEPETNIIKDIKRKIAIAALLLSPNIIVICGALIAGPVVYIFFIFLGGVLMLIYSICYCCKRRSKNQFLRQIWLTINIFLPKFLLFFLFQEEEMQCVVVSQLTVNLFWF